MNFHRPLPDYSWMEQRVEAPHRLASFERASGNGQQRARFRIAGIIGVLAAHGLVLCAAYFLGSSFVTVTRERAVTVVNIETKPEEALPPPPLPQFAPPAVYVPVQIMPDIELTAPPPPRETITLPPPPTVVTPPGPRGEGPPAPPAPPKPAMTAETQAAFAAKLFAHLNRFKRYPTAARLRHEEGVVSLRFRMDRAGQVLAFAIAKSSGAKALDEEALSLLGRAQPLPAIPTEFRDERLELIVPVEFSLR